MTNLERASFLLFPRLAAVGLKASGAGNLPWEEFRSAVRNIENLIEETGLKGAPESYWEMTEEAAKADVQAEHDRIYSAEALPFEKKEIKLIKLEKTERLMEEIGIPEPLARQVGDYALRE